MKFKSYPHPINAKIIPNLFTLANLLFGILSLIFTMDDNFSYAAYAILCSVLLDSMDGRVARRLEASTSFGKELDSLADLVSFGVAPAILLYAEYLHSSFGNTGLAITVFFILCGAVRLARFNVLNITTHFIGIPITVAGGLLGLLALLHFVPMFYLILCVVLAVLMVCNLKVPKY